MSVLIPVHNGEGYIGKAIRSVLAQGFRDFEVVVLDDGSTDGSARVARAFGDARVRVYRREEHEGVAATRNHLLLVAKNPLIAFLDVDDVAFPERLGKQVAFLDKNRDVCLVSSAYLVIDAQGQTIRHRAMPHAHDALAARLLHGIPMPASTVLVRRHAIDAAGGFDVAAGIASEYDLFLKIAEKAKIAAIGEPLVKCRVHSRAISYARSRELRGALDDARRRAVRRRYLKPLAIAPKLEEAAAESAVPTTLAAVPPVTTETLVVAGAIEAGASPTLASATQGTLTLVPPAPAPAAATGSDDGSEPRLPGLEVEPAQATFTAALPATTASGETVAANTEVTASPAANEATASPLVVVAEAATTATATDALESAAPAAVAPDAPVAATLVDGEATLAAGSTDEPPAEGTATIGIVPSATTPAPLPPPERTPQVAVVLVATGRGALAAVRSVLDQTLNDVVVAVVATQHDDGLERGLELLADERILLLESVGATRARALNLGLLATKSRYVAYLTEASVYRPEHLDRLVQLAEGERLGFVYADLGLATPGMPGSTVLGKDYDAQLLLRENYIPTETVLHRRELLDEVGLFNEGLEEGMEWELWAYLTRMAPTRRLASVTVDRVLGGSKALRLIAPSPARVRKYLAEKFNARAREQSTSPLENVMQERAPDGDPVARAQERFKIGDWAGAAAELVEAASKPFAALSQIFSPRFPERELPGAETTLAADNGAGVVTRGPRAATPPEAPARRTIARRPLGAAGASQDATTGRSDSSANASMSGGPGGASLHYSAARDPGRATGMPFASPALRGNDASALGSPETGSGSSSRPSLHSAAAGPAPRPLANEPEREAEAMQEQQPLEESEMLLDEAASTGTGGSYRPRPSAWLMTQSGMVGTGKSRAMGGHRVGARGATRPLYSGPSFGNRRKAMASLTQNPACPLCGEADPALAYRTGWYRILDCSACAVAFSYPRQDPALAVRFFSDRRPDVVPPFIQEPKDLIGTPYDRSRELSWVRQHVAEGKLVDVGCSWGYSLVQAQALGFEVLGLELSRTLARIGRERFGLDVVEKDFTELPLEEGAMDAVLAVHVMQHFLDPRGFLEACFKALRPGGVLVGSVPNFDAYLRETLGRRFKWLDPESQPHHFRPASLARELSQVGFDVEIWTSEGLYGEAPILEWLSADEATTQAREGRGSEIGFIAIRR